MDQIREYRRAPKPEKQNSRKRERLRQWQRKQQRTYRGDYQANVDQRALFTRMASRPETIRPPMMPKKNSEPQLAATLGSIPRTVTK